MSQIKIRKATLSDSRILFEWSNDPITRANSFNSNSIDWYEHEKWIEKKLKNPDSHIYIAYESNFLLGVVRFEITPDETIIGITISPNNRGQGLGNKIIQLGCNEFWKSNTNDIIAYIKNENISSIKAFEKAGFKFLQSSVCNNIPCSIYKITKNDSK